MNIKKTSWHARLWKWSFVETDAYLPTNFCSYFKQLLGALILLPITAPSRILDSCGDRPRNIVSRFFNGVFLWIGMLMFYSLGCGIARDVFSQGGNWILIWAIPCAILAILAFLLAVTLCIVIISTLVWVGGKIQGFVNRLKNSAPKENRKKNILVEFVKAKKNKYCPQIDWTE